MNTEDLETNAGRIYSNDDIKQYIEDKYGFKVHSAYIGQVREKLGIREHENYNDSHNSPRKPCVCPEEKEAARKAKKAAYMKEYMRKRREAPATT